MDQLPRLGKRELICLLLFTCNYMVPVWRGLLFLWVFGMGFIILLLHSLSLPYNYPMPHDGYMLNIDIKKRASSVSNEFGETLVKKENRKNIS